MKRGCLLVHFISFFCALFVLCFRLFSFVYGLFKVLDISAGLIILVGIFTGEPHEKLDSHTNENFWIPVKCVNHTHEMLRDAKERAQKVEDGLHCAISWMFRKIGSVPTWIHSEESESGCQCGPTEH